MPSFSISGPGNVTAGNNAVFTVTMTGSISSNYTIWYSTLSGTASAADGDYSSSYVNLPLTFTPGGSTTQQIVIPTLTSSGSSTEAAETFSVGLQSTQTGNAFTSASATIQPNGGGGTSEVVAGFDWFHFPGLEAMSWLISNTNLREVGYYLGKKIDNTDVPAIISEGQTQNGTNVSNTNDFSWMGTRQSLLSQGWNIAPIYVGQQDPTYVTNNSLNLYDNPTQQMGTSDGQETVLLLQSQGFQANTNTLVYLDWETGGSITTNEAQYFVAWCADVSAAGYLPGIYCPFSAASPIQSALAQAGYTAKFWTADINGYLANPSSYQPNGDTFLVSDPSTGLASTGSGFPGAIGWQYCGPQGTTYNLFNLGSGIASALNDAGITSAKVDLDTFEVNANANPVDQISEAVPTSPINAEVGASAPIGGVSVADAGGANDTFTILVSTASGGLVSASAAGGAIVSNSGTQSLTISGTLTQVDLALGTLSYENANAVSDTITVMTNDPNASNSPVSLTFAVTTTASHIAPTVTAAPSVSVAEGQSIAATSLIASISNPSGDSITQDVFLDEGGGTGYFTVNGAKQADNKWIYPAAGSNVQYVGGSSPGTDTLVVGIYDATTNSYSYSSTFTATTYLSEFTGGGYAVVFSSSFGNAVSLYSTAGDWDSVTGSNGTLYLTSAQTSVIGGGDAIGFAGGTGNVAGLYNTAGAWDSVWGSNGTVYLTSAQASVIGGGDAIGFAGGTGNAVNLSNTAGAWDSVWGSNGTISVNSAQATVNGTGDTLHLSGTSTVAANGGSDAFVFGAAIGTEVINGFASTDSIQFSATDFASWSALQSHISQLGANTVITLDSTDKLTLMGVTATSLTQSQFHFV